MRSLCALFLCHGIASASVDMWQEESISLLQLKARHVANSTRNIGPADSERKMCPHEIEAANEHLTSFGCSGTMRAENTKECSFWGEPHVSKTWVSQLPDHQFDIMYKPGLLRMAAAKDGSWEVQVFSCGTFTGAVAARFGKHIFEIIALPGEYYAGELKYYLDGKLYEGDFPIEKGRLSISGKSVKSRNTENKVKAGMKGACIDDPNGQLYLDINQDNRSPFASDGNLNVRLEAAEGSYTDKAHDEFSFCNIALDDTMANFKVHNWPIETVAAEDSLFIGAGSEACAYCTKHNWDGASHGTGVKATDKWDALAKCNALVPQSPEPPSLESECAKHDIPLANAAAACENLRDQPQFFYDCQFDFCFDGGNPGAVEAAKEEEHAENPIPVCAKAGSECDPASACCNALKDQAALNLANVVQNNLCGDEEGPPVLRYGSVLTQQGQTMDLVVSMDGEYQCGKVNNGKNGAKSDVLGVLAVQAGSEATFNFQFVKTGTDTPHTPTSMMISFLDIDQGKNGKQRESVEVCGAVNAFVTDNTELEQTNDGACIKFASTTAGTGRDNPEHPEQMSKTQRARAVAYQIAGSSFSATLGVAGNGRNPRKFLFAGDPSVACVLK